MSDNLKGILYASTTALLWGFLAIVMKVALNYLDVYSIAWSRFVIAFTFLLLWTIIFNRKNLKIFLKPPILLLIAGSAIAINYLGFISGVLYAGPSATQVFIQSGPILLVIAGIVIYKEKLNRLQYFGLALVIAGFATFYTNQISELPLNANTFKKGVAWVILAGIVWAIYAVSQKKLVKNNSTNKLNLLIYSIPIFLLAPFVDYQAFPLVTGIGNWIIILFLGLNTLVAYTCLSQALKYTEANKVSVIITLNPIITFIVMAILSWKNVSWIEHDHFSLTSIIGALLVLIGATITVSQGSRK